MKLLLFSDIHVNRSYCERICTLSDQVDVVVGAGDFGAMRYGITKTINWLSGIAKPSVLVPGNAESYQELKDACKSWSAATVLHGSQLDIEGTIFYGIGGGIPVTPFGSWSYDFTEVEAENLLSNFPVNSVLVSHSPPYGLLDISSRGQHLGSNSVRKVVDSKTPRLVVCGHIHESGGNTTRYGNTDIVNAGPEGIIYQL